MLVIDSANVLDANDAIRDILFMYRGLVESYRGFGHGIDTGSFDPFSFVTAAVAEEAGFDLGIDLELLHSGSAIAILCRLCDAWDEMDPAHVPSTDYAKKAQALLDFGSLGRSRLLESAIRSSLEGYPPVSLLREVYSHYVVGYLKRLATAGEREHRGGTA